MRSALARVAVTLALVGPFGCRAAPTPSEPVPLTVLASSSLAEHAREAAEAFQQGANVVVEIRSGGTHELSEELSSGRTADLFLADGVEWMDRLEGEGLIVPESRWEAVGNRMVLLGREEAGYPDVPQVQLASLGFQRFVVPDPSRDPAGRYARRWLRGVGVRGESVWGQMEDRLEAVANVHEVLRAVASDRRAVGVVFASDLGVVPGGQVLARSPDVGIRHSFALVERVGRPREARQLLGFLQSPEGIELLQVNGFLVEPREREIR